MFFYKSNPSTDVICYSPKSEFQNKRHHLSFPLSKGKKTENTELLESTVFNLSQQLAHDTQMSS